MSRLTALITGSCASTVRASVAVDHRRLGRWYLVFALAMALWGGLDALLLRTVLVTPGADVWMARTYDAFFTTHGLTMLFLFATPAIWGFAYTVVPSLIGTDRTAFPALGTAAFWLLPPAALAMRAGTIGGLVGVAGLEPVAIGWTMYPPLSTQSTNLAVDLLLVGLFLVVVSTVVTAANFVVTIARCRTIRWLEVDTFTWTVLTSAAMAILSFPVLSFALVLLLADRNLGTAFFVGPGGDPVAWQHLFWFFAHPQVYVLALPPMGILSHVLPRFSGCRLYGHRSAVYSTLAIGVLAFTVWGHHMFTTGMDPRARVAFMFVTLAVALPSAAKTVTWLGTLWGGAIRLTVPMLFALGSIGFFVGGGVTGVLLAVVPLNVVYNGTYYVVAHLHLMLLGLVVFAFLSGAYYWFPLLTGRWYNESLARLHFWLTAIGVAVTVAALLVLGLAGLPRRVSTYPAAFAPLHQLATVGAFVVAVGQLVFCLNCWRSWRTGEPAGSDPWSLESAPTHDREWRSVESTATPSSRTRDRS
ncbi:cbb3-type cytochrome c oxidase subunit I [Natronoglomus mannanivorans]|uniref:Cbb3-type cytochrome c oxidase subunit I n=1 Tax=Natronoglomus mannanivorans TaxID=2979990 RepID=A0AAP2Z074_9EURY|nr:cbb3-type cytochrome c oxidase subunit I [Halobacteria archaeon AArc-xg1-1]